MTASIYDMTPCINGGGNFGDQATFNFDSIPTTLRTIGHYISCPLEGFIAGSGGRGEEGAVLTAAGARAISIGEHVLGQVPDLPTDDEGSEPEDDVDAGIAALRTVVGGTDYLVGGLLFAGGVAAWSVDC
jgi:hypothetical protein